MKANKSIMTISGAALAVCLAYGAAAEPLKLDFSNETAGADPASFVNVVGIWRIEAEGQNKVLAVDGRQWKEGQTAAGLADKARTLYGDRYAEFLDRVQAFAYFPTPSPRTSMISATARSPCASRGFPAASIRAPASCST